MKRGAHYKAEAVRGISRMVFIKGAIVAVLVTACMTARVLLFSNPQTGLQEQNSTSWTLLAVAILLVVYLVIDSVISSCRILKVENATKTQSAEVLREFNPTRCDAIAFLVGGVFFLAQFVLDFLHALDSEIAHSLQISSFLIWACCCFSLFSAISFGIQGFTVLKSGKAAGLLASAPPVIWGIFALLHLVMMYPMAVSVQLDYEKVLLCLLALLFLFYLMGESTGFIEKRQRRISGIVRMIFPAIGVAFSAPYLIAQLFGIRDRVTTVSFVAVLGIGIMGFILLLAQINKVAALDKDTTPGEQNQELPLAKAAVEAE